jgi:hypothetical protein
MRQNRHKPVRCGLATVSGLLALLATSSVLLSPLSAQEQGAQLGYSDRVEIGGSSTSVAFLRVAGPEWPRHNVGNHLQVRSADSSSTLLHDLEVSGYIRDIEVLSRGSLRIAFLAQGTDGLAVVNLSDPTNMHVMYEVGVNFYQAGLTWTEGGGDIVPNNVIEGTRGNISAVVTDGRDLWIANESYGLHRTALSNLLNRTGPILEPDGTLRVDHETFTLLYAGEVPWGAPEELMLEGGRLFVSQGSLGLGIYDPVTLEKVGAYNLYTDASVVEDWFIDMDVAQAVQPGLLDAATGMPDYRQAAFEITRVWHGDVVAPTPWADFDRYGKWYYQAHAVDVADFGGKSIAYLAYGLGGMVAVDITGYRTATASNFLEGAYLGYAPGVPAHGPEEPTMVGGGPDEGSLYPHYGAGMLKEAGVGSVAVVRNQVYYTDHFAGLVILNNAGDPAARWRGASAPYDNDDPNLGDGVLGDHWPDYEFVTSYDMTPHDPTDHESLPQWMYEVPNLLVSGEVGGHGSAFILNPSLDIQGAGSVDVFMCVGGGGFSLIDVHSLRAPQMTDRLDLAMSIATTDEIGADPGGVPTAISIGHSQGLTISGSYLYLADGPHGVTAWKLLEPDGTFANELHVVANSLQDEYPVEFGGQTIYPLPHADGVVFDPVSNQILTLCQGAGLRRVDVLSVETGLGQVGTPLLIAPLATDIFEHNTDAGSVEGTPKQDHAYGVVLEGNLAFTADGGNGLTIYDLTKDPTDLTSGYVVGNLGGSAQGKPELGRSMGLALWHDPLDGKRYAFVAAGPRGVGVVDATNPADPQLVKVFEPIKIEDGSVGKADGRATDVAVFGDHAYFTYDSFGVVCYAISDLIAALPAGVDPTKIWKVQGGAVLYDYRPVAIARFRLKDLPGYEHESGGALDLFLSTEGSDTYFHFAYGVSGVVKVLWTDPANPQLVELLPTPGEATAVIEFQGRRYVADGAGGLVYFE